MPRNKSIAYVPPEERPEFITAMAALPSDPADLERTAAGVRQLYHDAIMAGDVLSVDDAGLVYRACVVMLNGGTHSGSANTYKVLEAKFAAMAGQVPEWGQAGEFFLEVEGMRLVVKVCPDSLSNHCVAEFHAVDFDKPFISHTGSHYQHMRPAQHLGRTVDQAVRAEVLELLAGEGKATTIANEYVSAKGRKVWPWLADALAGVRSDGQLAMFGDTPKGANTKAPLSNAARQRLFRQRQREKKATDGVQSIRLTSNERCVLSLGLFAREDMSLRTRNCADKNKAEFDALLLKLWPEGDSGFYLAELERQRGTVRSLEECARGLRAEVERLKRESALLEQERNKAHAAIKTWEDRLRNAGLSTDYRRQSGE